MGRAFLVLRHVWQKLACVQTSAKLSDACRDALNGGFDRTDESLTFVTPSLTEESFGVDRAATEARTASRGAAGAAAERLEPEYQP